MPWSGRRPDPVAPVRRVCAAQAASFAAAALLTVATFSGAASIAGHTYREASVAQLKSQPTAVAATQYVTVVGHRTTRA